MDYEKEILKLSKVIDYWKEKYERDVKKDTDETPLKKYIFEPNEISYVVQMPCYGSIQDAWQYAEDFKEDFLQYLTTDIPEPATDKLQIEKIIQNKDCSWSVQLAYPYQLSIKKSVTKKPISKRR